VRALAKEAELKAEAPSRASFDQARSERDQSCKMDVGNQVLRAALAKLGMVAGNFERAKKEKNVVTQVVAATTGISPDAIAHNGPLGGEHSVARQAVNAVVGGLNGAIRKGISDAGHFLGIRQQQSDHVHINPAGTSFVVPPGLSWPLRLNLRSISQCVSNRPQLARCEHGHETLHYLKQASKFGFRNFQGCLSRNATVRLFPLASSRRQPLQTVRR
jgi:hypothetical protein